MIISKEDFLEIINDTRKVGYKNWETTVIHMKWWDRLVFLFTGDRYFKTLER